GGGGGVFAAGNCTVSGHLEWNATTSKWDLKCPGTCPPKCNCVPSIHYVRAPIFGGADHSEWLWCECECPNPLPNYRSTIFVPTGTAGCGSRLYRDTIPSDEQVSGCGSVNCGNKCNKDVRLTLGLARCVCP